MPVSIRPAVTSAVEDSTDYLGSVQSLRSTTVQPQLDGQVARIAVKSGDRVAEGARLFEIDPGQQQAALTRQQSDLASREAAAAFARQEHARVAELVASGTMARQELDRVEAALKTADAEVAALRARINEERVRLGYFTVTAPMAGVVGDIPIRVGMQVSPQTMLTTIDRIDQLELHVPVPVERARDLRVGLPVHLLGTDGAPTASTTISFIAPRVDDGTQTILTKAPIANADASLRVDQFVRARVVWRTYEALRVPVIAVVRVSGQHFAYVVDEQDGKTVARQRAIKPGRIVEDDYIVESGLSPNDRVITSGVQRLADGAPIAPQG